MEMAGQYYSRVVLFCCLLVFLVEFSITNTAYAIFSRDAMTRINRINRKGPYLGIIVPNTFEMHLLLQSPSFQAHHHFSYLDFSGITTLQLLLSLFNVQGVLHFGIAGKANPQIQIGDVAIPQFWAHTGLRNWQRYGDGPDDELALESDGDYTRKSVF